MYVLLDENKRFTGNYAITGGINGINGGVYAPSLPPCEDIVKQKFHRLINRDTVTGYNKIPVMKDVQATDLESGDLLWEDEEKTIPVMIPVQDMDGEGNLLYTETPIIENICEWVFDESDEQAYNNYIKGQETIIPEKSDSERIADIEAENLKLKLAMTEIYEMMLLD